MLFFVRLLQFTLSVIVMETVKETCCSTLEFLYYCLALHYCFIVLFSSDILHSCSVPPLVLATVFIVLHWKSTKSVLYNQTVMAGRNIQPQYIIRDFFKHKLFHMIIYADDCSAFSLYITYSHAKWRSVSRARAVATTWASVIEIVFLRTVPVIDWIQMTDCAKQSISQKGLSRTKMLCQSLKGNPVLF